jgi:phosphatidylserine/phosphatidylglycerophosphate/cardiolipin synthase-like enzyme
VFRAVIGVSLLVFTVAAVAFAGVPAVADASTVDAPDADSRSADDTDTVDTPDADPQSVDDGVKIAAVLPNPVAAGDRGEYVVLSVPRATNFSEWSITDGDAVAPLPNRTVSGRVLLTTDPGAVSGNGSVLALRGRLRLANTGERIELGRGNRTVDAVTYENAPDGELYVRENGEWTWRPRGATDRPVVRAADVPVRSFVLPDRPDAPLSPLRNATNRILLGGYTITSDRVVRALCGAHHRGVRVRTLFEGGPVGGITTRGRDRLDRLVDCGIEVSVIGGEHARYTFHHAKYAVVDDAALVLTENWKPAGTGGRSSRGWGTLVRDAQIAAALAETFRADAGFRDAIPWERYRSNVTFVNASAPATERYPARFDPRKANATSVSLLVAPDNAASTIVSKIDAAEESVRVEQISIGSRNHSFVRAILRAARRGVTVRLLLGSSKYVRAENRKLADWLNERAKAEGLPLEARLATPRSRFGKIHAKGFVIDGTVVLGSINWTNQSTRGNREVAIHIQDEAVADYYRRVFRADWRGGVWSVSAGMIMLAAFVVGGATLLAARMTFESGYSVSPEAVES